MLPEGKAQLSFLWLVFGRAFQLRFDDRRGQVAFNAEYGKSDINAVLVDIGPTHIDPGRGGYRSDISDAELLLLLLFGHRPHLAFAAALSFLPFFFDLVLGCNKATSAWYSVVIQDI